MARSTHHVVPDPEGGWNVKRGGCKRASIHAETKTEATKLGRQLSQIGGTELVIHGKNGRIQRSDSHGNDPYPPEDKQ